MKEKFLEALNVALHKHFYKKEIDDIITYYEEIIEERLANGEMIESIIASYDIQTIVKEMATEYIPKRDLNTKATLKSTHLLLIVLLSTPLLLPIGITYIVLLSVSFAMIVTGAALIGSGFVLIFTTIIRAISSAQSFSEQLVLIGGSLIAAAILIWIGALMMRLFQWIIKQMVLIFTKRAKAKGGQ